MLSAGDFALSGIGLSAIVGVLLNLLLPKSASGAEDASGGDES